MLAPALATAPLVDRWLARHCHAGSFLLHMLGIPATILGVLLVPICVSLASPPIFLLALGLFIGGYVVQFVGHALDGTEPGEIAALKRQWGRRTRVAVRADSPHGVA